MSKVLLTSFDTWLPHQLSNSSDDLLNEIPKLTSRFTSLTFLRQLPVDVELSSFRVISKVKELQPDIIVCCGMAECCTQLTVESNASCAGTMLKTSVDLQLLVDSAARIGISHDAGKFVCEGLYYSVLKHLHESSCNSRCIFVHVPVLTQDNMTVIVADFLWILQRLTEDKI